MSAQSALKIGVLFNCQHETLAIALRALLPHAEVISYELASVHRDPALPAVIHAALMGCDHIISQDIAPPYQALSTRQLRRAHRSFHLLPAFSFGGFHPDSIGLMLDGVPVTGAVGGYHSRIAVGAFLAGLNPAETADLFNRLAFHRLGYFRDFAIQRQLLVEKYTLYGIDLTTCFEAWRAQGCFMHSVNHPFMVVMLDLARIACARMGLADLMAPVEPATLDDRLALHPAPSIYPDIAAELGMAHAIPARMAGGPGHEVAHDDFIRLSFDVFRRVPLVRLRAGEGVPAAMAALGLREPARARMLPPPGGTTLMTAAGWVLRMEPASGLLLQRPVWPDGEDEVDFTLPLPPGGLAQSWKSPLLGGVEVTPATPKGLVNIRRGKLCLSVEPNQMMVAFSKPEPGPWEAILPLPADAVATLRLLFAHHWRDTAGDVLVPRETINMAPNFNLEIGARRYSLLLARLGIEVPADGVPVVRITSGKQTLHLRRDDSADARGDILAAAVAVPEEAGSVEEFRAAAGRSITLPARREFRHAPLVVGAADQDWLMARLTQPGAPVLGETQGEITLARLRDASVLLGRGAEGVVFTKHGVAHGAACLAAATPPPEGITRDGPHLLISGALHGEGPLVEGPVCVPYGPDFASYAGWLTRGLLNLHVMAAYLPPQTRLLLPGTLATLRAAPGGFDHLAMLATLGLTQFKLLEVPEAACRVQDVTFLAEAGPAAMPDAAWRSLRDRVAQIRPPPSARQAKIYIRRQGARRVGNVQQVESFLTHHGFTMVSLEGMPFAEQIDLFASAAFVIGAHGGGLANLLFCAPGTRVIEFMPDTAFRPEYWLMAEKLGLNYAVLPTPTHNGAFNGALLVDQPRMRTLFRMLGLRD